MKNNSKNPQSVAATMGIKHFTQNKPSHITKKKYTKQFNRDLLPLPASYYQQQFPHLKTHSQWVSVCCCFHDDKIPSLRLNRISGAFRCFACGVRGGDIIAFHMQRNQMNFIKAVDFFGAWYE